MRFVKQAITSYTSPNITPEFADWNPSTTYAVGDKVLYGNYIWINSKTANINNQPSFESVVWSKYGTSNYYSLIDTQAKTFTTVNDDLIVTFPLDFIDTLAIGYYTAEVLKIENLDALGNVLRTQEVIQSVNEEVFDYFDYIYEPYSTSTDKAKWFKIVRAGTQIRVSFLKGIYSGVSVGFLVGGTAVDMGRTVEGVKLGWNSFSLRNIDDFGVMSITKRADQDLIDFETSIDTVNLMSFRRKAKQYKDEIVAFIVDDNESSVFENIVTMGVMQEMQPVATNNDKTILTWSILESI
jgi:hypothetical protein